MALGVAQALHQWVSHLSHSYIEGNPINLHNPLVFQCLGRAQYIVLIGPILGTIDHSL